MTSTPSPTDEDRELIERRIARSLARSDGIPDDAPVGDYVRNARDVYREVVESLLSDRAKLEERVRELEAALQGIADTYSEGMFSPDAVGLMFDARDALNRSTDRAT